MKPEKILMAHNYYQNLGGEEESFRAEMSMLKSRGHEVIVYTRSNEEIQAQGVQNKLRLFSNTIWAHNSYAAIRQLIREHRPRIAHFQNIFPLISPSAYYACHAEGIPVIQALRNYRLMCPNGFFFRSGRICEDCMGKSFAWPGILHACYRNSRLQTAAVAGMLTYHRMVKTWESHVDLYIALTEFSRTKFIQSGLSPEKIVVKPNYIPDPGAGNSPGDYAVYVGRLSPEKGIDVLMDAWKDLPAIHLKIVGTGPLTNKVQKQIQDHKLNAELMGYLPNEKATDVIKKSAFLVFPSLWYETFGRTILEAFACGKPVLASRHGTSVELIQEGVTGLFFDPGNAADLAKNVSELWDSMGTTSQMGKNARALYEEKYTLDKNYEQLMEIYRRLSVT